MRTPKSLQKLADSIGAFIEPIKFNFQGLKTFNGYAIVDADNNELMEIEPVHYSSGDRWKVINRSNDKGLRYYKTLAGIDKKEVIKAGLTGYKWTGCISGKNGRILNYGIIEKR